MYVEMLFRKVGSILSFELKTFTFPEEVREYLAQESQQTKNRLAEYLFEFRKLQEKATKEIRIRDVMVKLLGRKKFRPSAVNAANLGGIEVVVNPNSEQEQYFLEEVMDALQKKIDALNKASQILSPLLVLKEAELAVMIQMITDHGVPMKVMVKTTELYEASLAKKVALLESSQKIQASEKPSGVTT